MTFTRLCKASRFRFFAGFCVFYIIYRHILDHAFCDISMNGLQHIAKPAKTLVFSSLAKSDQGVGSHICSNGFAPISGNVNISSDVTAAANPSISLERVVVWAWGLVLGSPDGLGSSLVLSVGGGLRTPVAMRSGRSVFLACAGG